MKTVGNAMFLDHFLAFNLPGQQNKNDLLLGQENQAINFWDKKMKLTYGTEKWRLREKTDGGK